MERVAVELLKSFWPYPKPGIRLEVQPGVAKLWIRRGLAKAIEPEPESEDDTKKTKRKR